MTSLRNISFGLTAAIALILGGITLAEYQNPEAAHLYTSPWMIALWAAGAAVSLCYIILRRRGMSAPTIGLHASLLLILVGAAVTHFSAFSGKIKLEQGAPATCYITLDNGLQHRMPFAVALDSCYVEYHHGTTAARDYVSELTVSGGKRHGTARVAMNKVPYIDGYRFFQTSLGPGYSVLSVSHDTWGCGISYGGYILLGISMCTFFFSRRSRFRALLRGAAVAVSLPVCATLAYADAPRTIPAPLARNLGQLRVFYADRVMPLQTMARDFCLKVYGKESYMGLTSEQVLAGWLFYYDDWKHRPFIKIQGSELKSLLGTDTSHAALSDFYSPAGYKLREALTENLADTHLHEADARIGLLTSLCTGNAMKIFPLSDDNACRWLSWTDAPPPSVSDSVYAFMATSFGDVAHEVARRQWKNADNRLTDIAAFQLTHCPPEMLPAPARYRAELFYNRFGNLLLPAATAILAGVLLFVAGNRVRRRWPCMLCIGAIMAWLGVIIAARTVVCGHVPLSNGYETMLAMAWLTLLAGLLLCRRMPMSGSGALIVSGLAMMVAYIGRGAATAGNMMPVLASPLLSVHVLLVMCSYSLLALMWLNSISALIRRRDSETLARDSMLMLYPAVFFLAAGIFTGAVWANRSWGRYWGWDPKETWALITMLIYSLPLHAASWPALRRPKVIHLYFFVAFLSVLMTYFGVNYLMRGLHSYA